MLGPGGCRGARAKDTNLPRDSYGIGEVGAGLQLATLKNVGGLWVAGVVLG